MSQDQYLSVSQFNNKMKVILDNNDIFKNVFIKGEVTRTSTSRFGHFYFSLKDDKSVVPCVIYKWFREDIGFEIKNGMKLLVIANVTVYPPHGKYQLDVREVTEDGLGRLFVKYQQLKEKLSNEGLFNKEYKKPLPIFPKRIGVITSQDGSVIHDIIKTVKHRWPYCQVILFPSAVQGPNSKDELVTQIKRADSFDIDVLIVGRGGGSPEELWSFNEEEVVRAIFECSTPVITAIGHEDNVTLSDLVSDKRASTPTMAATLAISDRESIINEVNHYNFRLMTFISSKISDYQKQFDYMMSKPVFSDSTYVYKSKKVDFDNLCVRFEYSSNEILASNRNILENIKQEYVIRRPCKIQFNLSKSKLSELETRLIDAMDLILKTTRVNLDKTTVEFNFQSEKFISSRKHDLDKLKNSPSIKSPCKMQLVKLNSAMTLLQDRLNKSMGYKMQSSQKDFENIKNNRAIKNPNFIYNAKSNELNYVAKQFMDKSKGIVLTNSYRLNAVKTNPFVKSHLKNYTDNYSNSLSNLSLRLKNSYKLIINEKQKGLNVILNKNIIRNPNSIYSNKSLEFHSSKEKFKAKSNEIILINYYRLNAIEAAPIIKNPLKNVNERKKDFEAISNNDYFKNPYLILDSYKSRLNHNREKLTKLEEIIDLKKDQQKQKMRYRMIIATIVVIVIMIIVLLLLGGI